jgi:beta-glucosidase
MRSRRSVRLSGLLIALLVAGDPSSPVARPPDTGGGPNVPYDLPVQLPPANATSPAVALDAPYTPVVRRLLAQLLPSDRPTVAELENAATLLVYGKASFFAPPPPGCFGTGPVLAPQGTTPSIEQICWADAQGVLMTSGPNQRNTTAPMTLMGLAAAFDRGLGNVWGQVAGKEARWYMVTGIYGPQGDIDVLPNWGRNLTTTGEDPYLSEQLVAAQVNGIQGVGAQSQMKHFAVYNGQNGNTTYQDQWLHEIALAPYEGGYVQGRAAAAMCSYQSSQDLSTHLPGPLPSLWPRSPFATGTEPRTWPLDELHYSCEQPLLLDYVLRRQWGSHAYVASDYGALHSTSAILQGNDQEMPTRSYFFNVDPYGAGSGFLSASGFDPTGSTCADPGTALQVPCSAPGAIHVAGIPSGGACKLDATGGGGCGLVNAVLNGTLPLSVFKQALARILYQEERFGLLGCSDNPPSPLCRNPGGNGASGGDKPGTGTRTGTVILPDGPSGGLPMIGTKNGDAAIVEKYSEMGATLLKNEGGALPLTRADLARGVLVTGANANHTVADPTNEASLGFIDRNAVNPLQQLMALSGHPEAFTFVPANDPTGMPVPSSALSTASGSVTGSLKRTNPDGSTTNDFVIDYTTVSRNGQLGPGLYTWEGYVHVPASDTYTFRFESSAVVSKANVTFSFDGTASNTLIDAEAIYGASVPGTPTNAGYTEALLNNQKCALDTDQQGGGFCFPGQVCPPPTPYPNSCLSGLAGGTYHPVKITFHNDSGGPASFRFAYSRVNGDIADAAAAAVGKSKAIVFVNTGLGTSSTIPNPYGTSPATISAPISLSSASVDLIEAVGAANPDTIVVLNNDNPVLTPWIGSVKALLDMWFAGQEGGTSTARLLLGLSNPSGHTALTWPRNATDTIWGYDQPGPLYPGDTAGPHLERYGTGGGLPGSGGSAGFTQGIYSGYRFFDKMSIEPRFAFGHGLSYTTFGYRNLVLKPQGDTVRVSFEVQNGGDVAGTAVPQVYVGPSASVAAGVQQAVRALRGFERVALRPHETKRVEIVLDARSFQYWDEARQAWTPAPGIRTIWVGESSRDLRLSGRTTPDCR